MNASYLFDHLKKTFLFFIFLFSVSTLSAQQGWWTWVKGPNVNDQNAVWGTQGVAAGANNPAAAYGPFYWQDSQRNLWIWGGGNRTGRGQADMWMYNMATNQWTWKHGAQGLNSLATYGTQGVPAPTNIPAARQFGGASWIDNQDNLWLFGGDGWTAGNQTGSFAEMWKYNTTTNEWTWMHGPQGVSQNGSYGTQGVSAPANYPPGRRESCAAWVDNNGKFWLFGGESNNNGPAEYYNDIWRFDPLTNEWTWIRGSNTPNAAGNYGTKGTASPANDPPARAIHSHWIDRYGNLWFFGGGNDKDINSGGKIYNDLWKYDITANQWTWVRGANTPNPPSVPLATCTPSPTVDPPARFENRMCWVDSCFNFWMFGGVSFGTTPFTLYNDLWFYNVQNNTWTLARANGNPVYGTTGTAAANNMPTHRFGAVPFTDAQGNLWMFGGRDTIFSNGFSFSSHLSDIWKFTIDPVCTPSICSFVTANFFGTNLTGCEDLTVTFTNTSSANATNWHWSFGDGDTSIVQHPIHTYTAAGTYTVTLIASNVSASDTSVQVNYVTVYPNAVAAFTASSYTVCAGQNISFTNGSSNANSYSWNFGDASTSTTQNPVHSYSASGTYTVSLIAVHANGCNDTIAQPVTVVGLQVAASFTSSPSGCIPVNINFTNGSTGATSYNWNFGNGQTSSATNPSATYTSTGTYTVTLIASATNSFCTTSDTASYVIVASNGPTITASSTQTSCSAPTGTATANPTGGNPAYTYLWNNGASTSTATGLAAGNYTVTVTDASGCIGTQTVSVTQINGITAIIAGLPDTCSSYSGAASATITGGTAPYTYLWSNGASTSSASGLGAGNYTCTITDASGCTTTQSILINNIPPGMVSVSSDVTIFLGSTAQLLASGGVSYNWTPATGLSCTNCANPVASPNTTTTYTVISTDANGCTDLATVTVYVEIPCNYNLLDALLPNAFSPNDDSENDRLCPQSNTCIKSFNLKVFNRWGEKVFESESLSECWDGTYLDKKLDPALFVYIFEAHLNNGEKFRKKGNVSLIR